MRKRLVHDMSLGCFLITHRITLENIYIVYYLDFVECKAIKKEKCNNDAYYHLRKLLIIPRSIINPS
jgi:penicillin-binding protein-related factor A (putative recombinase)